jgi:DNA-binding LacI/PurR family transcriptional regulator
MFSVYRRAGLEATIEHNGLSLQPDYCLHGDLTQRGGFRAMNQLLDLSPPPTAVVACNDLMALGAISAAQKRGLVVGRDVTITSEKDPALIGGIHIRAGDMVIDGSVRGQLQQLANELGI